MRSCDLKKCFENGDDMSNDYVNEAIDTVAKNDGNSDKWADCDGTRHLANMINGWLGEELVLSLYPHLKYYGDDHGSMDLDRPTKDLGKPDLINTINDKTVEVKNYYSPDGLKGLPMRTLHHADAVVLICRKTRYLYLLYDIIVSDDTGKMLISDYKLKCLDRVPGGVKWCTIDKNGKRAFYN